MKRTVSFILSLCMLFSAVSCRKTDKGDSSPESALAAQAQVMKSDKDYHLRELPMPSETASVLSAAPLGNGRYIAAFCTPESAAPQFFTMDKNFSAYTPCDTQITFRENAETTICFANSADGTLYMAVTEITHGDMPPYNYMDKEQNTEDFDWLAYNASAEYFHTVYRLTSDGTAESKTEITGAGDSSISDFTVCGRKIYISCGTVYSADFTTGQAEEYKLSKYEAWGHLGVTADDRLICCARLETDPFLLAGENILGLERSGEPSSHISSGAGVYDAVFAGKTGIYGLKGDILTELALNVQLGINEDSADEIIPVENGYILSVFDQNTVRYKLYLLTDMPDENAPAEPVTLRLGIMYQHEDFLSHVAAFNRSGKNITVEPVYYTEFDVYDKEKDEQVSTGTEKLSMDLITGDGPDIAVFMKTPLNLGGKGAFADMYGLMDDELSREMFLPNILEACEYDGKLYSLPTSFNVRSMMIKEKFSGIENQTFDEMLETITSAPDGMSVTNNGTKMEMLISLISYSDEAIACRDGKYTVNAGKMEEFLKFCNEFPDYPGEQWQDFSKDEVLFSEFAATGFGDFRTYYEMFGEPVTFAGYPSENGEGNVAVMNCNIAVMEKCSDKQASWEFVKSMYIGENSNLVLGRNMEFPILVKDFEQLAEIARNSGGFTDEELEKAVRTVKSAVRASNGLPDDLFRIITEEAQPYFAGECTAEEAASYIDNRATIYISENE